MNTRKATNVRNFRPLNLIRMLTCQVNMSMSVGSMTAETGNTSALVA